MKQIIFFKLIILVFNYSYSQLELTLEDAVLSRWTKLYPEYLKDLQWNNEKDFFSYQNSDSTLYIMDSNNQILEVISLSDIISLSACSWNLFMDSMESDSYHLIFILTL